MKTALLLGGLAIALAAVFNVGGLKISHGFAIGIGLVVFGSLIPESKTA